MEKIRRNQKIFKLKCEKFRIKKRKFCFKPLRNVISIFTFFLLILFPLALLGQEVIVLKRLQGPVELDGMSDEPAWVAVEPLPLTMYQPTHRGAPTEMTEIRIAYDDNYVYAAGRFFDSEPSQIRTSSLYRDRLSNDDTFELILDTFNDNENALLFCTNPAGVRIDAAISMDGGSINGNWDTFWDVKTVQNSEGWFAEVRIPFSSLGFRKQGDKVVIGLIVSRYISRKNERLIFPDISPNWPVRTPSQSQKVELTKVESEKPVYLMPYLLGGWGENAVFNESEGSFEMDSRFPKDIGLDVKYNVTHNLTIDASLNTDFAQVEADDQRVNLTRFSLFFPEKRRFFQERAGIFSFGTAVWSFNRLFHSRRIGLHQGEEVPVLGGVRLVGRSGPWDIGLMSMQTDKSESLPSENFGILRLRRQVFNRYSYAGGILTSRLDFKGSYNINLGLDGIFRLFGDEYLILKWAQTFDGDLTGEGAYNILDSSSLYALWQRRRQRGLGYMFSAVRSGRNFNPEMGFVQRHDFTEFCWSISYNKFMDEKSPFRVISPIQIFGFAVLRNQDGSVESAQFEYDTDFSWKNGASIWADAELYYEDLPTSINFPENTEIPAGSHTFYKFEGGYNMGTSSLFRGFFSIGYGTFYDGTRGEFGISARWNLSRHLGFYAEYGANFIRFPERDQGFDAHIVRLRAESALNSKLSLNGFVQFNSVGDFLTSNLRLRYNFSEGVDLWVVYNEGLNLDRHVGELYLPRVNDRTILVKFTYTFNL